MICSACNGSGEGPVAGTTCSACGGSGAESRPWGLAARRGRVFDDDGADYFDDDETADYIFTPPHLRDD